MTIATPDRSGAQADLAIRGIERQLVDGLRPRPAGERSPLPGLTIIDDLTKECLAAIPENSVTGKRAAREMTALIARRGKPGSIVRDNVTEFTSDAVLGIAQAAKIDWRHIAPDKSTPNAFAESLQGKVCEGCLNEHRVLSMNYVRAAIDG